MVSKALAVISIHCEILHTVHHRSSACVIGSTALALSMQHRPRIVTTRPLASARLYVSKSSRGMQAVVTRDLGILAAVAPSADGVELVLTSLAGIAAQGRQLPRMTHLSHRILTLLTGACPRTFQKSCSSQDNFRARATTACPVTWVQLTCCHVPVPLQRRGYMLPSCCLLSAGCTHCSCTCLQSSSVCLLRSRCSCQESQC